MIGRTIAKRVLGVTQLHPLALLSKNELLYEQLGDLTDLPKVTMRELVAVQPLGISHSYGKWSP